MPPKVFLSHASEDKDRFVLTFATQLRAKGVDVWLDRWEMLPGDSLVDKIFDEGIKNAAAVIVVVSENSIHKRWVREELNAAFISKLNGGSKLIPVVIDDCEVPEALKSTVWVRVTDLTAFDADLDRIVASIFGVSDKPPIGPAPSYVQALSEAFGGLSKMDSLVLKLSAEAALKTGDSIVNPGEIFLVDGKSMIPEQELKDSLDVLDQYGHIKLHRTLAAGFWTFQVTTRGFETYANACIRDYQRKVVKVVAAIVNSQHSSNDAIQAETAEDRFLVNHILDVLQIKGHIKQSKVLGGLRRIYHVSPTLRRALAGN